MERPSKNFDVAVGNLLIVKSADEKSRRLNARLEKEIAVLSLLGHYLPSRVPEILCLRSNEITMEKLDKTKWVPFASIAALVEEMQSLPIEGSLPILGVGDYKDNADTRLRYLKRLGPIIGISRFEVSNIKRVYDLLLPSLESFETVFVHGDLQMRHFAKKNGGLAIFDFDNSHYGSELEDWAFLSIRHPRYSKEVRSYLENKYSSNNEILAKLDSAFQLMQIDKFLNGYFSRTYQWRGKPFDVAAKVYGREKLYTLTHQALKIAD